MRTRLALLLGAALGGCTREAPPPPAPSPAPPVTQVDAEPERPPGDLRLERVQLEWKREAASGELIARTRRPAEANLAVRALGRVGDRVAVTRLVELLGDAALREPAAQALGTAALLGAEVEGAEAALISAWRGASASERVAIAEALGRLGGEASVELLGAELGAAEPEVRAAAALGLGLLGRRKRALDARAREGLVALIGSGEPALVYAAAYGLASEHAAKPDAEVSRVLGDMADQYLSEGAGDPETLALALAGLARHEPKAALHPRFERALRHGDMRVQVAAVRALVGLGSADAFARLGAWFGERVAADPPLAGATHAALDAVAGLAAADRKQLIKSWRPRLPLVEPGAPARPAGLQRVLARLECQLQAIAARREKWQPPLVCAAWTGELDDAERRVLEAGLLGEGAGGPVTQRRARMAALLTDADARVRAAAVTAAAELWADRAWAFAVEAWLVAALDDRTSAVVGAAAEAITARFTPKTGARPKLAGDAPLWRTLEARARRELDGELELYGTLVAALAATGVEDGAAVCEAALAHANASARKAARDCVKALTGAEPESSAPAVSPAKPPVDPVKVLGREVTWTLQTSAGRITIALDPAAAPWHVASLVELTSRGFYDGLRFHRVVPGFVVQGGDPEGTGWGGPGYSLPSEPSQARYDRGAVGIADAGKDTGGSQFFIMHARAPHLEGRYTWVGRVVEGIEVADALVIGDAIVKAEVSVR